MLKAATEAVEAATAEIRDEVIAAFARAGIAAEHWFTTVNVSHGMEVSVHVRAVGGSCPLWLNHEGWHTIAHGSVAGPVPTADEAVALLGLCAVASPNT
jgi:hypothetical protein